MYYLLLETINKDSFIKSIKDSDLTGVVSACSVDKQFREWCNDITWRRLINESFGPGLLELKPRGATLAQYYTWSKTWADNKSVRNMLLAESLPPIKKLYENMGLNEESAVYYAASFYSFLRRKNLLLPKPFGFTFTDSLSITPKLAFALMLLFLQEKGEEIQPGVYKAPHSFYNNYGIYLDELGIDYHHMDFEDIKRFIKRILKPRPDSHYQNVVEKLNLNPLIEESTRYPLPV